MTPVYLDPAQSIEARVDALLADMTLEEKVAQLTSIWAFEVLDELEFSAEKAAAVLGQGIGQVTRIGGATNLDPPDVARLANQIQRYLRDHTRLGIPALIHEESCSG